MTETNSMIDAMPIAHQLASGTDRLAFFCSLMVMGTAFAWYARQQAVQKVELIKQLSSLHAERISEFKVIMNDYRDLVVSVRDALNSHKDSLQYLASELKENRHRQ